MRGIIHVVMNPYVIEAVNRQIKAEFEAGFLYLAFSVNLHASGLPGMSHWMREQYREECGHALRLISHLELRNAPVQIPTVSHPEYVWERPQDLFRLALEHEQRITSAIHDLLELCVQEKDYAMQVLLFDYVKEQVEEEHQVEEISRQMMLCGSSAEELLGLDCRMAARSAATWE